MKNLSKILIMLCCLSILFAACKTKTKVADVKANYPEWVKNAVIYEVNTRQFSNEGTFKAFESHLPRLKELGVDILWFMPIHPIGIVDRKIPEGMSESLGSYYSVRDYKGINPEFGTSQDFKSLVTKAHEMGFKVIIDWVANHSSRDNAWITEHPDWYVKDSTGKIVAPFDWTDVAKLDYKNAEMRAAMIDAMKYWVSDFDIDGFRCDVAGEVPVDFWEQARVELAKVKPLFMLAEEEGTKGMCEKAFDANYGWGLHHAMHKVAKGEDSASMIVKHILKVDSTFPKHAMQMNFITNHDENSWNGTAKEKFGDGENVFAMLTYTLPGMPLIYNGQEAGLNHRLAFFVKDSIKWELANFAPFYTALNTLKHNNEALWNPPYGGNFENLKNSQQGSVLTFIRNRGNKSVLVFANLSAKEVRFTMNAKSAAGNFTEVFDKTQLIFKGDETFTLPAWGYKVYEK